MMANYNQWDLLLIVCVSIMGTAFVYLHNPEHKTFMLMLPVLFTFATLTMMFGYTLATRPERARKTLDKMPSE